MFQRKRTVYETETAFEHYQVVDMVYEGRPARVLFTNNHRAAQSGISTDREPEMLFDYNQRFLELARSLKPKNILIIGGGTYTLPQALTRSLSNTYIDVVEPDPELDAIAQKFFNFIPHPRLHIVHTDGRSYLENTKQNYELIIVDAFNGSEVPYELLTLEAAIALQRRTTEKGVIAMNAIGVYQGHNIKLKSLLAAYQNVFKYVSVYPADDSISLLVSQNFIIIGQQNTDQITYHLRTSSLQLPTLTIERILFDSPPVLGSIQHSY